MLSNLSYLNLTCAQMAGTYTSWVLNVRLLITISHGQGGLEKRENTMYVMQWIVLTVKLPSPCGPVLIDEIEVRLNMYCIKAFLATE